MNNDKSRPPGGKAAAGTSPSAGKAPGPAPGKAPNGKAPDSQGTKIKVPGAPVAGGPIPRPPPLFRGVDWLTFLITTAAVWIGYYLTLAPEQTLEDSGELATGSFWAAIPHPPGYPVWTIYTWLWTQLLPFGNIAWRVALGHATSGAVAAGLLGLLVSRGSSLLMEGIEELSAMTGRWESAICMVSGFVAGMLIGYNGFFWSQCVIVEVYAFSVCSFMIVLLFLLRWIYAPHQWRYLLLAMFFHGVCFTNHQTLIVAAMGIEVAIAAANSRYGRYLFLLNAVVYLCGLFLKSQHILTGLDNNQAIFTLFNLVGIGSGICYVWFSFITKESFPEFCMDGCMAAFFLLLATVPVWGAMGLLLALCALGGWIKFAIDTWKLGYEWLIVIVMGICWILGASFYFYMPLAGMTNPPIMWGYPREFGGFMHAFTRGQYEKTNPTAIFSLKFLQQLTNMGNGIREEFNWVCTFLALVPFAFFKKLHRRERAWLIGITAIYLCLGVLLMILLNPPADRAGADLNKVFFTASHALVALLVGYGLTLIASYMATHYQLFRRWGAWAAAFGVALALWTLADSAEILVLKDGAIAGIKSLFGACAGAIGTGMLAAVLASYLVEAKYYEEARTTNLIGLIGAGFAFVVIELCLLFSGHLGDFSGVGQLMGAIAQAFARNQYGVPVYAGLILTGLAVLFGLGLLFYRQRAPLGLALLIFALLPVHSIMTHWSDNEQRNHWFGYWFGHDMFNPPFKGADGKPLYPDMTKDAVLFGGTDPGRFCPTYMIFVDSFTPSNCLPAQVGGVVKEPGDQKFDRRDVYIITQNALADGTYLEYIRAQFFRSAQIDQPFFREMFRTILGDKEYQTNILARMSAPLDRFFTDLGASIEKRRATFTSWLAEDHFTDLQGFAAKLRNQQDPLSKYLYENLKPQTQQLLSSKDDKALRKALATDLNVVLGRELDNKKAIAQRQAEKAELDDDIAAGSTSTSKRQRVEELAKEIAELSKVGSLYTADRFKQVQLSDYITDFIKQNPQSYTRIRLNRLLLEAAYPSEIASSKGGVYPDREIYTPSPEDSQKCFNDYLMDAQRRLQMNPPQLRPGEDVQIREGKVQVSGQVAVMAINGLLTKVIFDHNPKNEFFVEESFPLDWMYPYLTPFGIIMKINRQTLPELSEEICKRDHEFWKQFSKRLTGDFMDYDTPVKEIADWIEKTYLHRNFSGFKGDPGFIRDDQGQKAFSKLRSSIGGIYAWRISDPKSNPAAQQRMIKEADFAFRQAWAFCPYSPEAVFRYAQLLLNLQKIDDAYIVASTALKFDPNNGQVIDLVKRLESFKESMKKQQAEIDNPNNFQAAFNSAGQLLTTGQTNRAMEILDRMLNNPLADAAVYRALADAFDSTGMRPRLQSTYEKLEALVRAKPGAPGATAAYAEAALKLHQEQHAQQVLEQLLANPKTDKDGLLQVAGGFSVLHNLTNVETALDRVVKVAPDSPEGWYDLAAVKVTLNKNPDAIPALKQSFELSNKRLQTDPKAADLVAKAKADERFAALRLTPEYQQLVQKK